MGTYDGIEFVWTAEELALFEKRIKNGEACPICDARTVWEEYYACSKRFESAKAESQRCKDFTEGLQMFPIGDLGKAANALLSISVYVVID